jgi:hypothetical protein
VPLDLGSSSVTGIHAAAYRRLKQLLGVDGGAVKIADPFQMLAEVEDPVKKMLGVDTCGLPLPATVFGFRNQGEKPWMMPDGTEVLMADGFVSDTDDQGNVFVYPRGDRNAAPSGKMPKEGYYFDPVIRQKPISEKQLDAEKWVRQSFSEYTDEDLRFLETASVRLYEQTDYGIVGNFCDGGLGDIGIVPGPNVVDPEGVRDPEEWYVSLLTRKNYIAEIFELQTELALKNLRLYHQASGDRVDIIDVSETDFGGQRALLFSADIFRELFKPRFAAINSWIHDNTSWKIFYHSCGSIAELMEDLIEIGVDILNPVQYSAQGMELRRLKQSYGDRIVFWGGGIDTQHVLPFGTPEQVREEIIENLRTLSPGGGFVFSAVHNIQANVPTGNIQALFDTFREWRGRFS